MTPLPEPPGGDALTEFPAKVWVAHQPLWRVHLERHGSVHFAIDDGGRFNPPSPEVG